MDSRKTLMIPQNLYYAVDKFIAKNPHLGFEDVNDFATSAIREKLFQFQNKNNLEFKEETSIINDKNYESSLVNESNFLSKKEIFDSITSRLKELNYRIGLLIQDYKVDIMTQGNIIIQVRAHRAPSTSEKFIVYDAIKLTSLIESGYVKMAFIVIYGRFSKKFQDQLRNGEMLKGVNISPMVRIIEYGEFLELLESKEFYRFQ